MANSRLLAAAFFYALLTATTAFIEHLSAEPSNHCPDGSWNYVVDTNRCFKAFHFSEFRNETHAGLGTKMLHSNHLKTARNNKMDLNTEAIKDVEVMMKLADAEASLKEAVQQNKKNQLLLDAYAAVLEILGYGGGSWFDALGYCISNGAILATLKEPSEDQLATEMAAGDSCWVGLRKYKDDTTNVGWTWIDQYESLAQGSPYLNWGKHMNIIWKLLPPDERCGEVNESGWRARPCWGLNSRLQCFICSTSTNQSGKPNSVSFPIEEESEELMSSGDVIEYLVDNGYISVGTMDILPFLKAVLTIDEGTQKNANFTELLKSSSHKTNQISKLLSRTKNDDKVQSLDTEIPTKAFSRHSLSHFGNEAKSNALQESLIFEKYLYAQNSVNDKNILKSDDTHAFRDYKVDTNDMDIFESYRFQPAHSTDELMKYLSTGNEVQEESESETSNLAMTNTRIEGNRNSDARTFLPATVSKSFDSVGRNVDNDVSQPPKTAYPTGEQDAKAYETRSGGEELTSPDPHFHGTFLEDSGDASAYMKVDLPEERGPSIRVVDREEPQLRQWRQRPPMPLRNKGASSSEDTQSYGDASAASNIKFGKQHSEGNFASTHVIEATETDLQASIPRERITSNTLGNHNSTLSNGLPFIVRSEERAGFPSVSKKASDGESDFISASSSKPIQLSGSVPLYAATVVVGFTFFFTSLILSILYIRKTRRLALERAHEQQDESIEKGNISALSLAELPTR